MSLGAGLSNAAYAFGTVLAVMLAQHYPQRRMLLVYAVFLVIGVVLAAAAQSAPMFITGRVIQGLCTSLMLIAAVPPLALGYPISKLKTTAMIMNMCIFGAVALGPAVGGLQAQAGAWRPLFWITAGIAAVALVLAVLTFEDAPPADPTRRATRWRCCLAAVGCVAAFFGASQLTSHAFLDPIAIVPLIGGLALIVTLVVYQATARNPLLTIREMLTSTIPVAGIVLALLAAAASVSATALTAAAMADRYSPLHLGLLYLPELAGAVITAVVLGNVINQALDPVPAADRHGLPRRRDPGLPDPGPLERSSTLVASFLTGIGLGASVAPALFVAGFALRATNLQRVFAIVELLRAVAAFMIAPIFAHFALNVSGGLNEGVGIVLWIGFALAILGGVVPVVLYRLGGARPETPDLEGFLAGEGPAYYSPRLLDRVRNSRHEGPDGDRGGALMSDAPSGSPAPRSARRSSPTTAPTSPPTRSNRRAPQLVPGREAIVVVVWQPADVGFVPVEGRHLHAAAANEVKEAAEETAAHGAKLAAAAGFKARAETVEAAPTWKGLVKVAEEHQCGLIVIGSHQRGGLLGHLAGSVAAATVSHFENSILVIHKPTERRRGYPSPCGARNPSSRRISRTAASRRALRRDPGSRKPPGPHVPGRGGPNPFRPGASAGPPQTPRYAKGDRPKFCQWRDRGSRGNLLGLALGVEHVPLSQRREMNLKMSRTRTVAGAVFALALIAAALIVPNLATAETPAAIPGEAKDDDRNQDGRQEDGLLRARDRARRRRARNRQRDDAEHGRARTPSRWSPKARCRRPRSSARPASPRARSAWAIAKWHGFKGEEKPEDPLAEAGKRRLGHDGHHRRRRRLLLLRQEGRLDRTEGDREGRHDALLHVRDPPLRCRARSRCCRLSSTEPRPDGSVRIAPPGAPSLPRRPRRRRAPRLPCPAAASAGRSPA